MPEARKGFDLVWIYRQKKESVLEIILSQGIFIAAYTTHHCCLHTQILTPHMHLHLHTHISMLSLHKNHIYICLYIQIAYYCCHNSALNTNHFVVVLTLTPHILMLSKKKIISFPPSHTISFMCETKLYITTLILAIFNVLFVSAIFVLHVHHALLALLCLLII